MIRRLRRWLAEPEIIGAPDCPIMLRWTIIDSKPATVSPSSNGGSKEDGDSFFRHKIVALIELPKRLTRDRKLMVHRFLPNVEDRDPHDHPRSFWTLVLRGRYFDLVPCPECDGEGKVFLRVPNVEVTCWRCRGDQLVVGDVMKAGTIRRRAAEHTHITQSSDEGAWTVVLMGPLERSWGFWKLGRFWPWKKYEAEFGFAMRCPTDEEREGRMLKYADDGEVTIKDVGDAAKAAGLSVGPAPAPGDHQTRFWRSPWTGIVWALPSFDWRAISTNPIENTMAALRLYRERGGDPYGFGPWVEVFVRRKCASCPKWVHENRLQKVGPSVRPVGLCIDCFLDQTKPTPRTEMAG